MLLDQLARARRARSTASAKSSTCSWAAASANHVKTKNNADGMAKTLEAMELRDRWPDLRQPGGFRSAVRPPQRCGRLRRRARAVRRLAARLRARCTRDDLAILTADHGCDPTTPSTDHSREYVPLLVFGPHVQPRRRLGLRATLSDIGQTVAANFGADIAQGTSFLPQIV